MPALIAASVSGPRRWAHGLSRCQADAQAPRPSVLLLDEPTFALDPQLAGDVLEVIRRLTVRFLRSVGEDELAEVTA